MKGLVSKRDFAVAIILLLVFFCFYVFQELTISKNSSVKLSIVKDGVEIEQLDLKDGDYVVLGDKVYKTSEVDYKTNEVCNRFLIRDGVVDVISANCADEVCTRMREISRDGEMIVCLPHKLYFKIIGSETEKDNDGLDAISN